MKVYWWRYGSWNYGNISLLAKGTANKCKKKNKVSKKRCLKSFQSFQSTSALHPFNPPQNGGPGAFFNRANRGSPKNPSISTQPPKVQKGGVARVEQWTFGHDGHHWTHCSGCPVGWSSLGWDVTLDVKKHTKHTKTLLNESRSFSRMNKNKKPPKTAVEEPRRFLFFWLGTN